MNKNNMNSTLRSDKIRYKPSKHKAQRVIHSNLMRIEEILISNPTNDFGFHVEKKE